MDWKFLFFPFFCLNIFTVQGHSFLPEEFLKQTERFENFPSFDVSIADVHDLLQTFDGSPLIFNTEEWSKEDMNLKLAAMITPVLNVSEKCFSDSMEYINGLNSAAMWALAMYDANGKLPAGIMSSITDGCDLVESFGDPNFCEKQPFGFLYKLLKIPHGNTVSVGAVEGCITSPGNTGVFSPKYVYFKTSSGDNPMGPNPMRQNVKNLKSMWDSKRNQEKALRANTILPAFVGISPFGWGKCIPDSCSREDVLNNYNTLFEPLGIKIAVLSELTIEDTTYDDFPPKTLFYITLLSVLGFVILTGTLIEIWEQSNPHREFLPTSDGNEESTLIKVLKCFSVVSNGKKILNTDPPPKGSTQLGCINGIRVISLCWVVLGHTYITPLMKQIQNPAFTEQLMAGKLGGSYEVLLNALPSVDTFFFLSGTLVAYLSFIQLEKKKFNLIVFYIHRYIRLTIPYAFVLGFVVTIEPYLSWGMDWQGIEWGASVCEKNGWINILYLNNFLKQDEQCMGVTWYLANDMQFYILSPLFILPLWFNFWIGLAWWTVVFVSMTFVIGWFVLYYQLPPAQTFVNAFLGFEDGFDMSTDYYMKPYIRFPPYMIGIIFGYILYKTKNKEIKIPPALNIGLWQAAIVGGIAIVYGLAGPRAATTFTFEGYEMVGSVFYNCFHRAAWSIVLGWVIFACVHGYGGIIDWFLSWGFFAPLARMSYMAYLIHMEVTLVIIYSMNNSIIASNLLMVQYFIGIICITFAVSYVASLAFEAPFLGLEKMIMGALLGPRPKREKSNGNQVNGSQVQPKLVVEDKEQKQDEN